MIVNESRMAEVIAHRAHNFAIIASDGPDQVAVADVHVSKVYKGRDSSPSTFSIALDNGQLFLVSVTEVPQ